MTFHRLLAAIATEPVHLKPVDETPTTGADTPATTADLAAEPGDVTGS